MVRSLWLFTGVAGCGSDWCGQDQQAGRHCSHAGCISWSRSLCGGSTQGDFPQVKHAAISSIWQAKADHTKTNADGKTVAELTKDSDVLIVLKNYNVLKTAKTGFNDEEYLQDDEEDD